MNNFFNGRKPLFVIDDFLNAVSSGKIYQVNYYTSMKYDVDLKQKTLKERLKNLRARVNDELKL